jgi:hypothetical protein
MICCRDTQMKDLSRLLVGLVLTNMLAALGESKLISPSNVAIFFLVFSSAVIVSLQRIARAEGVYDFPDAAYPPAGHPWPGPYPG